MERTKESNINMDNLYIAWAEDRDSAAPRPLWEWIAQYPAQSTTLIEWASAAPLLQYAEKLPTDAGGEKRVYEIGLQVVAEMRAQYSAQAAPPVSLKAAAQKQGMTLAAFAQKIGVGLTIASKLDRRLLNAVTIPAECVRQIAETLILTQTQVRAYLQQGPTLAQGAMYKASSAPQVSETQDFAAAIRTAPDMREEDKAFWLSQKD